MSTRRHQLHPLSLRFHVFEGLLSRSAQVSATVRRHNGGMINPKTLNLSGFEISRAAYGMMGLAHAVADERTTAAHGISLLNRALELGVNCFDTAQFYSNGVANQLLNEAFSGRRGEVSIISKVGAEPLVGGPVPMQAAQAPAQLREQVERNLETLGSDYLDMVYLRRMDMQPGLVADDKDRYPMADQLDELATLRDEGLIRAIGLSHVSMEQVESALDYDIKSISNIYNMLARDWEPMLELAQKRNIFWMPFFPLGGQSFLPMPRVNEDPTVIEVAAEVDATPAQVGGAWMLHHAPNTALITGTTSMEHMEENATVLDVDLSAEQMARLDALGK